LEVEAFIDMDGDLHDPDFRYFPAAESFVSQSRGGVGEVHGRGRRRSGSSGRGGGASSPTSLRRPYWELDNDHAFLSDEEEEEEMLAKELGTMDFLTQAGHGNGTSASESSAMRSRRNNHRRDGSSYGFVGFSGYSSSAHTSYHSPAITTSTLPTSYDSDNTMLSTHVELEEEREKEKEKENGLLKWRRRIPKDEKEAQAILETTHEEDWQAAATAEIDLEEETQRHLHLQQQEHVPTCGEAFKRHWLSFSLRFRTSVYRSRRRVMRRVLSFF
jgi:hypothetical protein